MPTITAPGIGSGLDVNSIVTQLMALEERPVLALQQKEAGFVAQLSAMGQLRSAAASFQSAVDGLKSFSDFDVYKATSADTAKFTASAGNTAAAGTYDIKVDALAQAQKMGSSAFADSGTTTIGNAGDKMTVTVGASSFKVDIGGKTLSAIASAINGASDNIGVTASVLKASASSYYLVLSSDSSGTANSMTLTFEDSGGTPIADPLGMAEIQAAQDAQILVDGTYTITRSDNTITDAIQGVTLTLLETSTAAVRLDVTHDSGAVTNAVEEFVDAYNALKGSLDELGDGDLSGDSTLRLLEGQIRSIVNAPPSGLSGAYRYLSDIGVTFQKDGTLSFESSDLSDAVTADLGAVSDLFANDNQGYAFRLSSLMDSVLGSEGLIEAREDGLNARIEDAEDRIASLQLRLEMTEKRYRAQFTALDSLMGSMQATSSYLDQQLKALTNLMPGNRNNN